MKNASDIFAGISRHGVAVAVAVVVGAGAFAFACNKTPPSAHADRDDDPMRCASCHTPEFNATTQPPHPGARPTACGACHTQSSWGQWRVAHPWWELTGAHVKAAEDMAVVGKENQVKCFWCHRGEASTWKGTKKACVACHAEDRGMSKFPGHGAFDETCEDCHSTIAWKPTRREIALPPPVLRDAGEIADAAGMDAAPDAARPKPVYVPRPIPTATTPPTATVTTTATTKPTTVPTTPPTTKPTTVPTTPPDIVTRPSRHR